MLADLNIWLLLLYITPFFFNPYKAWYQLQTITFAQQLTTTTLLGRLTSHWTRHHPVGNVILLAVFAVHYILYALTCVKIDRAGQLTWKSDFWCCAISCIFATMLRDFYSVIPRSRTTTEVVLCSTVYCLRVYTILYKVLGLPINCVQCILEEEALPY